MTYFFFNDTATTEIYTLSLHDALPICGRLAGASDSGFVPQPASLRPKPRPFGGGDFAPDPGSGAKSPPPNGRGLDRKSTRLNSSHGYISYAVFCLKKKKSL